MAVKIGLIHGDGIGPEIVNEAQKVLDAVSRKYGCDFEYENLLLGGASIDATGLPLTEETVEKAKQCAEEARRNGLGCAGIGERSAV